MRNDRFDSTALILSDIWFAKEAIDYSSQTIDWDLIDKNKNSIVPSSSEEILIDLATQFWTGHGKIMNMFLQLDSGKQVRVIDAIKIRFGY